MFGHGMHRHGHRKHGGGGRGCEQRFARFHHRWGDEEWSRPFAFGKGFGGFGPPGDRKFGRGDLKYVILDLTKDRPRHGYDVIRALEERFHGFYKPSAGSVYPTLQLLEDQGYLTSSQQDGKRVYAITEEGKQFLAEHAEEVEHLRGRGGPTWGPMANPDMRDLIQEVRQLGQFVFQQGTHGGLGDPAKVRRLRDAVARARVDIEAIFKEDARQPENFV